MVATGFFNTLVSEENLKGAPYLRFYLLLTMYTEEKSRWQASGPAQAAFIEANTITTLMKKGDVVTVVESMLREARAKYLPFLEPLSSASQSRLDLVVLADLVIR